MEHEMRDFANLSTMVTEVQTCSLPGAGGMLRFWPYYIADMDVGHYLPKQHKVQLLPGECAALVPHVPVVLSIKILVALQPAATPLRHEFSQLLVRGSLPR